MNGEALPGILRAGLTAVLCAGLTAVFAVPLAIRLYGKCVGGHLSDREKLPSAEGVRAWLCAGNIIPALLIALCAWLGYDYSFWGVLALTLGLVLAYPIFNMLSHPAAPQQAPSPGPDLSPERERVLRMLEEGKITAEEGAELLSALGESAAPPPLAASSTASPTRQR